jgi:hypothetical protein
VSKRYYLRDDGRLKSANFCVALVGLGLYANWDHLLGFVRHFQTGTWNYLEVVTFLMMLGSAPYLVVSLLFYFREGLVLAGDQLEIFGFRGTVWKRVPISEVASFRPDTPTGKVEYFRLILDRVTIKVPTSMVGFSEFAAELKTRRFPPADLEPYPVWGEYENPVPAPGSDLERAKQAIIKDRYGLLFFLAVSVVWFVLAPFPTKFTLPVIFLFTVFNAFSSAFQPIQQAKSVEQLKLLEW